MSSTGWGAAISLGVGLLVASGGHLLRSAQSPSIDGTGLLSAELEEPGACSSSAGSLTRDRVSGAARDFLPGVLPCVSEAQQPPADTLHLRLEVACTGTVDGVHLVDQGDWPVSVVSCVTDRLGGVLLPAHADPEGAIVDLPLRFPPLDAARMGR